MPDISDLPDGTRIEAKVRGLKVTRPKLGGLGAMTVDGTPGWVRRIDEFETITVLVNVVNALTLQAIDDRMLAALPMLAEGATNEEIAQRFFLTVDTFRKLLETAMRAWGARNRTNFVAIAYRHGVLGVGQHV